MRLRSCRNVKSRRIFETGLKLDDVPKDCLFLIIDYFESVHEYRMFETTCGYFMNVICLKIGVLFSKNWYTNETEFVQKSNNIDIDTNILDEIKLTSGDKNKIITFEVNDLRNYVIEQLEKYKILDRSKMNNKFEYLYYFHSKSEKYHCPDVVKEKLKLENFKNWDKKMWFNDENLSREKVFIFKIDKRFCFYRFIDFNDWVLLCAGLCFFGYRLSLL